MNYESLKRETAMQEENWQSKEQQELDLRLENKSLETDISLQGGHVVRGEDIDPEIENAFLKDDR
jgi:hypothetical protein